MMSFAIPRNRLVRGQTARRRSIAIALLFATVALVTLASSILHAQSNDTESAQDTALRFWAAFDTEAPATLYASMAPAFKQMNDQQTFVQNIGLMRIQLGGAGQARTLIGSQALSQMPNGQRGEFFFVRHRARFPNGDLYQDVTLQKVNGQWMVGYFSFAPAPPNQ